MCTKSKKKKKKNTNWAKCKNIVKEFFFRQHHSFFLLLCLSIISTNPFHTFFFLLRYYAAIDNNNKELNCNGVVTISFISDDFFSLNHVFFFFSAVLSSLIHFYNLTIPWNHSYDYCSGGVNHMNCSTMAMHRFIHCPYSLFLTLASTRAGDKEE